MVHVCICAGVCLCVCVCVCVCVCTSVSVSEMLVSHDALPDCTRVTCIMFVVSGCRARVGVALCG